MMKNQGYTETAINTVKSYSHDLLTLTFFDLTDPLHHTNFYKFRYVAAYNLYEDHIKTAPSLNVSDQDMEKEQKAAEKKSADILLIKNTKEESYNKALKFIGDSGPQIKSGMSDTQMKYYENLVAMAFGETMFIAWENDTKMFEWINTAGNTTAKNVLKAFAKVQQAELDKIPYLYPDTKIAIMGSAKKLIDVGFFTNPDLTDSNFVHIMKWAYYRWKKYFMVDSQITFYNEALGVNLPGGKAPEEVYKTPAKVKEEPKPLDVYSHVSVDVGVEMDTYDSQKNIETMIDDRFYPIAGSDGNSSYNAHKLQTEILNSESYKFLTKIKLSESGAIANYTNGSYRLYNHSMRKSFNPAYEGGYDPLESSENEDAAKNIKRLQRVFNNIPPVEKGYWVFRNCNVKGIVLPDGAYNINENIVDAGMLSTSIRTGVFDSSANNTKFMIYIPKGSRVIPALNISSHPGEQEIMFPPMSILRPIDVMVTKLNQYATQWTQCVKCIYIGTAMNSFLDKHLPKKDNEQLVATEERNYRSFRKHRIMTEAKEMSDEDKPDFEKMPVKDYFDKASFEYASKEESAMIMDQIKAGILKVEK